MGSNARVQKYTDKDVNKDIHRRLSLASSTVTAEKLRTFTLHFIFCSFSAKVILLPTHFTVYLSATLFNVRTLHSD